MEQSLNLKWHDTFAIASSAATVAGDLQGDKIILPQTALEQLLSLSTNSGQAPLFGALNAPDLPDPLTFRLVNEKTKKAVYAGIREFSAAQGSVVLSPYLLKALGLDQDSLVSVESSPEAETTHLVVHVTTLPRGSYARLRPLEAGYNPDDWRPLLERQLRHFTSLTKDTTITVQGGRGENFELLIDKLGPAGSQGVCVVNADLEVDIEPLDENQARETLRQVIRRHRYANGETLVKGEETADGDKIVNWGRATNGGNIDIWKPVNGTVATGCYVDYTLPSWDRSQPLQITLSDMTDGESLDLFVTPRSNYQRALPRDTEHVFSTLESKSLPINITKTILISPTNVEMEKAESLKIAVFAHPDRTGTASLAEFNYTLRAEIASDLTSKTVSNMESAVQHGKNEAQCFNCYQWVPKQTQVLHESFCRRNNIACPMCQAVFRKDSNELAKHWHCEHDNAHGDSRQSQLLHNDLFHGSWACPRCTFVTNSLADLARHRSTVCPGKIILCQFCHLEVPQEGDPTNPSPEVVLSGLTAHELSDGSRTTNCHLCERIVRLRDMQMHLKHHELDNAAKLKPPICRNANCGRTQFGVGGRGQVRQGPGTDVQQGGGIGLCSHCFGPLYVSMHDPDGKALVRRIERRYLSQLISGCRKKECANEWCKTGRANTGLETKGSSAQTALPLVKPLVASCQDRDSPMFLCTDEASQAGRKLAVIVCGEGVWDLEWCIAAAEAEKGNVDKMYEWLEAWAPRRQFT